jgi:hypothetical protein
MILHSAVHLFSDGEFDNALRDLFDLQDLTAHFIKTDAHWHALIIRANELNLSLPLYYALRYLKRCLHTNVPPEALNALKTVAPGKLVSRLLDGIFERGLLPNNETCRDRLSAPARMALYIRGHSLRMPLHLLVPHLTRKALMRMNLLPE